MDHLFVVTYGRSGSTLLQGLLNAIPGTLVRGENDFFLRGLFLSHQALARTREKWSGASERKGSASAFYGADQLHLEDFERGVRELVDRQLLGDVAREDVARLGFKEVLWHEVAEGETGAFLDFLDAVFPEARYVLHRRSHEDVLVSGFWKRWDEEKAARALVRVEQLQDALATDRPDRVCWTSYEELTSDDPAAKRVALTALARFVVDEVTPELVDSLMATTLVGHGPNPRQGQKVRPNRAASR